MAEKKCKFCATMIPAEAKICPNCRKRQGLGFLRSLLLVFFAIAVFGVVKASINQQKASAPASSVTESGVPEIGFLTPKGKILKAKHPAWADDACNAIAEKKIFIGMTRDQVIAAWGKPHKINTTTTASHNHEQWVMHDSIDSSYLYFDDGVLRSMQQSK